MNDDTVAEWVGLHYQRNFSAMSEADKQEWRERYAEAHEPPTLHERVLTMLGNALEGSFLRTGSNETWIRKAMSLIRTADAIERCRSGLELKVVESGRDCDGVEYDGHVHVIEATLEAFEALHDQIADYADGPFRLAIVPWDTEVEYTTRDLVAEAHEDGHRHSIVSRFP